MKGIALVYALVIMFVSVMLITTAIILSTTEIKLSGTIKTKTRKLDAAESGLEQYARIYATPDDVDTMYGYVVGAPVTENVTVRRLAVPSQAHAAGFTVSVSGESKPLEYLTAPVNSTVQPGISRVRQIINTMMSYGPLGYGTGH